MISVYWKASVCLDNVPTIKTEPYLDPKAKIALVHNLPEKLIWVKTRRILCSSVIFQIWLYDI